MRKHPKLQLIGETIRNLRVAQGYSQEGFAADCDMDRTYYAGVERGERNVSALNLVKIALALGVEVGELFPPSAMLASQRFLQ